VQGVFDDLPAQRDDGCAHRLLFSGQLVERKGLAPFIAALQNVARRRPQQQIEMRIVGGGALMESLRAMQHPANLHVELLGPQTFQQLGQHYAEAGILVLPTLADEWGMVVNEAMAAGLPVLGSVYSQAVEELVDEGTTGWVFRPDVASGIEAAIETALNTSVAELNQMRELARKRVASITPEYAASQMIGAISAAMQPSLQTKEQT
jgi:glycosyltransferase involved in cell wall biosynthesis